MNCMRREAIPIDGTQREFIADLVSLSAVCVSVGALGFSREGFTRKRGNLNPKNRQNSTS